MSDAADGYKRDGSGKFAPGTKGGPGRPLGYSLAFHRIVTPQALAAVLRVLLRLAKEGDLRAAELLLKRALPAPVVVEDGVAEVSLPDPEGLTNEELGAALRAALLNGEEPASRA